MIAEAQSDWFSQMLTPGDGLRFYLDLGQLSTPQTPDTIDGTFLGYDEQFGAWRILEWSEEHRRVTILNEWITTVETCSRPRT